MKRFAAVLCAGISLGAAPGTTSPVPPMKTELARTTTELTLQGQRPPYYAAYWVVDFDERTIEAVLGSLVTDDRDVGRKARVELRVGTPNFDNTNFAGQGGFFGDALRSALLNVPFSTGMNDPSVLRHSLWLASDANYKSAIETLEKKRAARQSETSDDDDAPSFSLEPAVVVRDGADVRAPGAEPIGLAREASRVFLRYPSIQTSEARVVLSRETRYFVSSDKSEALLRTPYAALTVLARTQAPDGMELERSWSAQTIGPKLTLPTVKQAQEAAEQVATELTRLSDAPPMEDYSGPVLFEGIAAAQVVYDLLGEAVSGTPAPRGTEDFDLPLARKRGKRVAAELLSVIDDPTLASHEGLPLLGHYLVDDEGRKAERVSLIEHGRLKNFLMSRTPRSDQRQSNGHGRSGLVGYARGHVGNLIVTGNGGLSKAGLRQQLLRAVRAEGGQYGVIVAALEPRPHPSSGQSVPRAEIAYKLHLDGREELVRGATFATMSPRDLKDVLAVGRTAAAYHFLVPTAGFAIPCSVVSPGVLFEDVEIRKETQPKKRPPVWPSPLSTQARASPSP